MAIFVMTTRNATTTNVDQMASLCPKYFQHRLSGKSLSLLAYLLLRANATYSDDLPSPFAPRGFPASRISIQ